MNNCTFLFASLAKVGLGFKKKRKKVKTKKNSDCLVFPSLLPFGFLCFLFLYEVIQADLHILPDRSCTPGLRPSFVQIPDEGGSNRTGRNTRTSRITYP